MEWVIAAAVVIAFGLIVILKGGKTPQSPYRSNAGDSLTRLGELPEHHSGPSTSVNPKDFAELTLKDLETFCRQLLNQSGLIFRSIDYTEREFHILAACERLLLRGNLIVCGHLVKDATTVESSDVIGFSDMVKAERAMKGVYVTNGLFSEEVMKLNEGAVIELIDVTQLSRFMRDITPELLPQRLRSV